MSSTINITVNSTSLLFNSVIVNPNLVLNYILSYLSLIFIIFGIIGFFGNAFTFLQVELRLNTFCIYSFCSSIADVSNLLVNRIPRYLYQIYGYHFAWDTNGSLCKLEIFVLVFLPQLAINFLVLSLIDRYACTCHLTSSMRRLNQPKLAGYFIGVTVIYSALAVFHGPTFGGVVTDRGCVAIQPITNSILYGVFCGLIQPLVMLVFVFLTYRNIARSRRRVVVVSMRNTHRSRNQFISLVFIQVFVTSFLSLQWIIIYTYYLVTMNLSTSVEQRTIIFFIYLMSNCMLSLNSVKSFYLSTLTCRLFRKTFRKGICPR